MYYPTRYSSYNPVYPIYADELYHHGIKGQRWGHRNGPPYPLNAQTHAAVVRSAGNGGKRGRIGSASEKDSGPFFQYNRKTGLATDPMGRWEQRNGYRDADSLYTKKGKRAWTKIGAATVGASSLLGTAAAANYAKRYGLSKKDAAKAIAVSTLGGAAAGALAGGLGTRVDNLRRKYIYGPVNKAIIGGDEKGHVGSSSEMSDAERRARRRRIARNIAIGAGGAAAAGLAGYGIYRAAKRGGASVPLGNADRVKSALSTRPVTNKSFHPKSAAVVNGRKLTVRERRMFTRAAVKNPRITRSMHNYNGLSPAQKKKVFRANQQLRGKRQRLRRR